MYGLVHLKKEVSMDVVIYLIAEICLSVIIIGVMLGAIYILSQPWEWS